ncbi:MAG: indolepyruvate oxidoreductase subunit beta [Candidatus Heteroscillospira sp.]|jgi:indolepyruvate ferredoxin oxidoreductase beta subunit
MSETKSIMIVGVGGQGTLLASRILGSALLELGHDVKLSEVHGMSQRGGSVVTYVKYGDKVYSPVVDKGEADFILSFERLEAARWLSWLKKDGEMIVNDQRISPMPVITGAAEYPGDILNKISAKGAKLLAVDALALALEAGSSKAVNVVLIGILASMMDIPRQVWDKALEDNVKPRFLEMNKRAFQLGYKAGKK